MAFKRNNAGDLGGSGAFVSCLEGWVTVGSVCVCVCVGSHTHAISLSTHNSLLTSPVYPCRHRWCDARCDEGGDSLNTRSVPTGVGSGGLAEGVVCSM